MLRFCSLRGASSNGHGAHGLTGSWSEEEVQKMAMRLGIVCYVFPSCRTRLGSQRRFFSLSISRHHAHSHSVRHSLPSSETPGLERVLPGFRRRLPCRLQATASSSVDGEGEWEISEARAGRELDEDVGTSGQGMGPPRTGRVAGRGERRQVDWMRGWDDGLGVETGSEFDNSGGGSDRGRGGVRRTANGVDDRRDNGGARFRRSESGSQASSSDTRREAFSRFLHRGSRQEDQAGDSPEWEPGFYANDSRTSPAGTSSSPWSRLSKSLSEAPAQNSAGQGSGVGGRRQVSSSSVAPVKPDSGLPPLSKFFPDSIVNPFSNPPPARRGFFSQLEGDEDAAVEGRKLGEDLWGTRNPAARFASKSVGSRSVPSNPSIPGRYSKYSKKKSAGPPRMYSTSAPAAVDVPTKSSQVLETQPRQNPAPWLTEDSVEADVVVRPHLTEEATSPSKSVPSPGVTGPTFSTDVSPSEKPENSPPSQISAGDQSSVDKGVRSDEVHESFPSPVPTPLPFEFQYSYSEVPKVAPVKVRNQFSPFGPQTMDRPWTGKAPLKKSKKKNAPEFDSFKPPPQKKGIKFVQQPGPFPAGKGPKPAKTREEIIGEPLTKDEIKELVESCIKGNRQLNLGRDGLTHNMLDLVHSHWKRRRCIKIKCKGVPTVDMDNVCFHLEDKTGGLIIERVGGTVYLYRGRYYNYKDRPFIPLMLWKPLSPIYPKLIKAVPDGMTREEVHELRKRGRRITPLKKLNKNGVYMHLVQEVRDGFLFDDLVRLDCKGLNPSDYKKIGAKLKDLVPCVLLSFEKEQLLLWKGRDLEAIESQKHPVSDSSTPGTVDSEGSDDSDSGSDVELADESSVESDDFNVEAEQTVPDGAIAELDSVDSTLVVAELQSEQGLSEIEDKEEAGVKSDGESSNGSSTTGLPGNEPGERNPLDELWEGAIEAGTAVTLDQPESLDLDQLKEKAQTLYVSPPRTDTRHAKDKSRVKQKKTVEESSPIPFSSTPERGLPLDELAKLLSPEVN